MGECLRMWKKVESAFKTLTLVAYFKDIDYFLIQKLFTHAIGFLRLL